MPAQTWSLVWLVALHVERFVSGAKGHCLSLSRLFSLAWRSSLSLCLRDHFISLSSTFSLGSFENLCFNTGDYELLSTDLIGGLMAG